MEDKIGKIRQFYAACDELIAGNYRDAEKNIREVLVRLAASEDLTGLFNAVTEEFDYAASKDFYLRESDGRRGAVYLPTGRVESLAFVFCLLAEIDSGKLRFNEFLLRYFYVDGSYTASYSLFADRIVRPFRDVVKEAFRPLMISEAETRADEAGRSGYGGFSQRAETRADKAKEGNGYALTERTVKRNVVFEGRVITVRCDDAVLPDGRACTREVVSHPGGAAVLCVRGGQVALVRQFRYPYMEELLEIPAGKLERGEDPAAAASRELTEETGLTAGALSLLTVLYPSPGYTDEKIYIYEAQGASEGAQKLDRDEFLRVEYLSLEEAYAKVAQGEIRDAKTIAALLLYKNKRGGRA